MDGLALSAPVCRSSAAGNMLMLDCFALNLERFLANYDYFNFLEQSSIA